MTHFKFIFKSFIHYFKSNLMLVFGIAVSTAVLTGALIVGDSIKYSLEQSTRYRLGKITQTVTAGDRFFSSALSKGFHAEKKIEAAAVINLEGIAQSNGGENRANKISVWGVDSTFASVTGVGKYSELFDNQVAISNNLATKLNLSIGDNFIVRMKKVSLIPSNAPFVSDENEDISIRVEVKFIVGEHEMGLMNFRNIQTAPFNLFISIDKLSSLMQINGRANMLLIAGGSTSDKKLEEIIRQNWSLSDAGITLELIAKQNQWQLTSDRVFIDKVLSNSIKKEAPDVEPILTYFVNKIERTGDLALTPYSFVSTLADSIVKPGEIFVNSWLANDLSIKEGDYITMTYFKIGTLRVLTEKSERFRVKRIVQIDGRFGDRTLMPSIPGLSDSGNCKDWETGVPIKLDKIRDKDEAYWKEFRGTPKAFIANSQAVSLWENRFGTITAMRFDGAKYNKQLLESLLQKSIDPFQNEVKVNQVMTNGMMAAKNGTDFSQLFIGLSFFIILSSLILSSLLFVLNFEQRSVQIGTLSALGFTKSTIRNQVIAEALIIVVIGALIGTFLSIVYNRVVFLGLNNLWFDIVRTKVLEIQIKPSTLFLGFILSVFACGATLLLTLYRTMKRQINQLQHKNKKRNPAHLLLLKRWIVLLLTIVIISILGYQIVSTEPLNPQLFFLAGGLLLITFLLLTDLVLTEKRGDTLHFSFSKLQFRNIMRNKTRSILIISMLALGSFLVITTGLNRQDVFLNSNEKSSGTGGFLFYVESTVPILNDLNDLTYRQKQGISEQFSAVQIHVAEGDDASCLNLNKISNPRIFGVDALSLQNRFSFLTSTKELDKENPWKSLSNRVGECIPAIADQTVIQWGLGMKVGDTLLYRNSTGETLKLKLIGGLSGSIFQGSVLIDNQFYIENFPFASGTNVCLIEGSAERAESIRDELLLSFRDAGWEITPTAQRLATFKSVENTYLSIFMVLGGLGLIIGTIGLSIVLIRSTMERKGEFSLLLSLGFTQKQIIRMLVGEYTLLLLWGIGIGSFTAFLSTLPSILSNNQNGSLLISIVLISAIILNGIFWVYISAKVNLSNKNISRSLIND